MTAARVDGDRLLARLAGLRTIGATADGGVTREAFGPLDVEARDLVASWMGAAGLSPTVDPAANLVGRRAGSIDRWLASGSHLDTVVDGGWLDGAYGAVAAVEVAAALADASVELRHGLAVVGFANEEGARGSDGMTGSLAISGRLPAAALERPDDEGVTLGQRFTDAGGDPARVGEAAWDATTVDAFVELHIEQGPVLRSTGSVLGVVTAVTGRQAVEIEIRGRANHAGTTPMALRHDAMVAGAEVILALEALALDGSVRVATCGHLLMRPNVRNVVPGRVVLGAELRDEDADRLDVAMKLLEGTLDGIGARRGVDINATWGQRVQPTHADPAVLAVVRAVAAASGLPWEELPSGAGHDAQIVGEAIPMGMLFVPSVEGVSHSPEEDTDPAHLVAGAQALLDTILALDGIEVAR